MAWSRSFGWVPFGSGWAPSPCARPIKARFTSVTATGSTEDPVLACSIADALKPLARLPELWLELACHVGLIEPDPAGDRLLAASSEFWTDNAVHLPQMIATGWMGLQSWQELEATSADANAADTALPFLRFALLLLLSALGESEWAATGRPGEPALGALAGMGPVVVRGTA